MGMTAREVNTILLACILMVLAASANIWYYIGVERLRKVTRIDENYIHLIKTLLPVGTVAGTIVFSVSAELVGRKITLLAVAVPYTIAFTLFQFARTIPLVCLGQVISGISLGGTLVVLPIYIGEMAAPSVRGFLGTLMSVFFHSGTILYGILGAYTNYTVVNVSSACIAVIFFIAFLIMGMESPFYYVKKKEIDSEDLKEKVNDTFNEAQLSYIQDKKFMKFCGSTGWIKAVTIMVFLILVHHLSGVYMVPMLIHYIYTYFQYRDIMLNYQTILLSSYALQLAGTLLCLPLVDRFGRKTCLMISTLGIGIFLTPMTIFAIVRSYYNDIAPIPSLTIIFVIAFLIFFNIGIYPVPQILIGELFPYNWKTVIVAILVSMHQVSGFMLKTYYPEISYIIGHTSCLIIYALSMFVATVLIHVFYVETKRKSLQEIQLTLKNK